MGTITNQNVKYIGQQRPTLKNHHGSDCVFKNYLNAYDKKYFSADRYISDSRLKFRKDIYKFVKKAKTEIIQILLHPFQYARPGNNYPDKLCDYTNEIVDYLDKDFRAITTYRDSMKNKKLFNEIFKKDQ